MARKSNLDKDSIADKALECFLEFGFEETTFKQIAKKMRVTQPSLYRYYKNKMDLISYCCFLAAQRGRAFIDLNVNPKDPAFKRLSQYIEANFKFFKVSQKERFAITGLYFFGQTNDSLKLSYQQLQKLSIDRFEIMLIQISYEKQKKLKNSQLLAEFIHSLMVGEIYKCIYEQNNFSPVEKTKFLMEKITLILESSWI